MDYLSIKDVAEKWRISPRRVQVLCASGRLPGAIRIGNIWAIPKDIDKPKDERIKSGKYIKNNN